MAAVALPPSALPRLGSLLRLLGSDLDGEVLGAARAIGRVLAGFSLTLHDLAAAVERQAERAVVEPEASVRGRRGSRRARQGDVELGQARRRAVADALRRGLAGGRMSEWERDFAVSLAARLQSGQGRLSERQAETLLRLLHKIGEGSAWA